jgi:hypothetical protein
MQMDFEVFGGLGSNIGHGLFVGWVESRRGGIGFLRRTKLRASHFFCCQRNPTKWPKIEPSPFLRTKGKLHMKRKILIILILLVGGWLVVSCGTSKFIPEGSQSLGIYEGSFLGQRFSGSIRVHLYQAPDGTKLFEGNFEGESLDVAVYFRGKMVGTTMEGEFSAASGTISGKISSGGNQIMGDYRLTSPSTDNGTWKAKKN